MRLDKASRKSFWGFVHVFLWAGSVVILSPVFAAVKAPENVCYTKGKTKRKCFLFSYPGIAYVIMNCSSSIWKDGMQSSFLRRYLMQNLVAASNWHDKRVTARGWHSSHPSCHWKHNALQCACSSGAAVWSRSLGCVTEQLHVFASVCGASLVAREWEVRLNSVDCFSLVECNVKWMRTVGFLWSVLWCGKMSSKVSNRQ